MGKSFRKYWNVLVCVLLFTNVSYAAKVSSSKSYLNKLNVALKDFDKSFNSFKTVLNRANFTKSFVSTDFWGLKQGLYVDIEGNLGTRYPFARRWLRPVSGYEKYSLNYVRNINEIIFSPKDTIPGYTPVTWLDYLSIHIDSYPDYYSKQSAPNHKSKPIVASSALDSISSFSFHTESSSNNQMLRYLSSHGVPQSETKAALSYLYSLTTPAKELITEKAYKNMDSIYNGIAKVGALKILERIENKIEPSLDLKDFCTPIMHKKYYPLLMKNGNGIEKTITSRKILYCDYYRNCKSSKNASIWKFYNRMSSEFSVAISANIQNFEVSQGMSKSQKYNSLIKLKEMLDKKVTAGIVKKSKNHNYTVYEDAIDKHTHGRIGIDYKTGNGFWQVPFWNEEKHVKNSIKKIDKATKNVNIAIKNYLDICLEETVKKFKNNKSQTNDF